MRKYTALYTLAGLLAIGFCFGRGMREAEAAGNCSPVWKDCTSGQATAIGGLTSVSDSGKVATSVQVCTHTLNANVCPTASEVGAVASSSVGAAGGVCPLDSSTHISTAVIPDLSSTYVPWSAVESTGTATSTASGKLVNCADGRMSDARTPTGNVYAGAGLAWNTGTGTATATVAALSAQPKVVVVGITEAMQTLSDTTVANVSTATHGYVPKGDGSTLHFLDGTGAWSAPAGGAGSTVLTGKGRPDGPTFAQIQQATAGYTSTNTSIATSISLSTKVTVGNLLMYEAVLSSTPAEPTDNLGTLYTLLTSLSNINGDYVAVYAGLVPRKGKCTIVFPSVMSASVRLAEFAGVNLELDGTPATFVGNASTFAAINITTTNANDLIWGIAHAGHSNTTYTAGSGYTGDTFIGLLSFFAGDLSEWKTVASSGTQSVTFSTATQSHYGGAALALKLTGSAVAGSEGQMYLEDASNGIYLAWIYSSGGWKPLR